MFAYFILGIVLYFIYRLVVGFVLPLWRTTKTVRENIHNMQQKQAASASHENSNTEERIKIFTDNVGDYIDFEDIKDKDSVIN